MPFPLDPANDPIARIRLTVGDTNENDLRLDDDTYQWLLDTYTDETSATLRAVTFILGQLALTSKHERLDFIETYGKEIYDNYRDFLQTLIDNPTTLKGTICPIPFAGGISLSDMNTNDANSDNFPPPIYSSRRELDEDSDTTWRI